MPSFATSKQISAATSAFAIFIGCLVLVGWGLDIAILKSVFAGAATMKANTAVCFILAGVSLWLTGRGGGDSPLILPRSQKKRWRRYGVLVAQTGAIASSTIAILTLSQYLFGWNLGIDELLFRDSPLSPATSHPGRMGINTTINFSLLGGALMLLHKSKSAKRQKDRLILLAQALSLGAILIALQALVGYVYKVEVFYQFSPYTNSMSMHTAVTFLVLGVGLLFARPQRGLMQTIASDLNGGIVARRMIPSAIALPLILCWIILQGQQANYYDAALGMSLLAVLMSAIYIGLIWRNAAFLNQLDGKRKRAEAAVRESEARYSIMAENVPEILFTNLPDGSNDYTSPRFYEYTGMPPGAAEGFGWAIALHPDDAEPSTTQWMESVKTGQIFEIEYRFRRADGVYRWFKGRCIPLRDEEGKIKKWFGVCTDIDDQKRTQEQLRQSQERLQRMVETAQIGIAFGSSTGEVFEANNAFLEMVGYTREEMLSQGLNWCRLTPPEYGEINYQAIAELSQTGAFNSVEKELFRNDGFRIPVLVSGTRLNGARDEHVAFIVDLSDRKQIESQLRQLNETLEERVKQRTAQLEATNQELESFSYSVSHDLRAPLRHITGFVDLLRKRLEKTALDDTSRHYIEVIVEATKQAGELIDDLLAFSRMGRAEMRYSIIDMNLLLREVQHDLESETKNRQTNWQIEPLPQVIGDSSMLRLVIRMKLLWCEMVKKHWITYIDAAYFACGEKVTQSWLCSILNYQKSMDLKFWGDSNLTPI